MPNWPPSSSCVMPSTVTGTTPYHHNDLKRLFMHNPLLDRLGALDRRPAPGSVAMRTGVSRSEEHTSELQSPCNLVCRLLLEKKQETPGTFRHTHRAKHPAF